ncbi:CHAT domain-containing tetratricopeptide repeat protein [Microcoleus sp. bin38.metabat.b11b12b14.051]|uniref:CHAT domain-containing protein n=1 Tax=Microcoleus sp. bin38.metabat.b11b12b14.051 TaxID=2742709 RepID=UPI0025E30438|nr:CHAT domain-containing tetratricopeptide repeat protein [Microcoleus sp. bin38.metabat.b11b12b14.051]
MKRIIISVLVLGVFLTPLTVPPMVQPSRAQSPNAQSQEVEKLIRQAMEQQQQGKSQPAIETWQQILSIVRQLNDLTTEVSVLNRIGTVYNNIGQPKEALKYFNQALPISREVRDRYGEVLTLTNIGLAYDKLGKSTEALKYYNQALPIWQEVRDRSGEARTLTNIGSYYQNTGKPEEALKYYNQALPIWQEVRARSAEARTLTNIGWVYDSIGKPEEALKYYNQALPISQEVHDRFVEAVALNGIGWVHYRIGKPEKALDNFKQALAIWQEGGDRSGEATTLNNMGLAYDKLEKSKEALEYLKQALKIRQKVRDRPGQAATLTNMGLAYNNIGKPEEALEYLNEALPIMRSVGDRSGEATTLNNMGLAYQNMKQPNKALKSYNQALEIRRKVGDRPGEAVTLTNMGLAYRDINKPTDAIKNLEDSIKITLEMRSGLQRENRQKFLQANNLTPIALTSLLIDQNQADRAFQWVNIATTVDLADYTRLINAKVANPQAQKAIDEWNQKNQQLQSLRRQLEDKFSENLSRQIRESEAEVNRQAEQISRSFPEVAELFETKLKDIAQLKASISPGTVVIQPVLLTNAKNVPNTIAIFVLTKDSLNVKKIAIDPTEFDKLITQYREQISSGLTSDYKDTGGKLYDILIRPVEDKIQAFSPKQLSIIATGKLRYIPFEALLDKQTEKYLIEKYPINYLTRISTRSSPDSKLQSGILALGNPVPRPPQDLPGSEAEVRNIAQLFPGSPPYIGNTATLDKFKTQAPRFPFLHLATHGCFQPEGCQKLDMKANTLLFADTQFNIADAALLGLQNTRLLTLSACQTALQANSNGEEISGIAYVFERAGANAVMASLWSVDDSATQELMVAFYQNINKGMSKAEALRQAKLSQIKISPHPFYWSPFILIGDAR